MKTSRTTRILSRCVLLSVLAFLTVITLTGCKKFFGPEGGWAMLPNEVSSNDG